MIWAVWRRYRWLVATAVAILVVTTPASILVHAWIGGSLQQSLSVQSVSNLLLFAAVALPLLAGVLVGVPLLSREFEQGTYLLGWTQSATRRRWLLAHLGGALAVTVVFSAILSAELAWAYAPFAALATDGQRLIFPSYDVIGLVPIASMLLGLSLGILLGALCKRTVIAIVLFVVVFAVFRGGVIFGLRPYLVPPVVATAHITSGDSYVRAPSGAWVFLVGTRLPNGSIGDAFPFLYGTQACPRLATSDPAGTPRLWACMDRKGYRWVTEWQPADRWWGLQLRETAIYLALSIVLLLLTWGLAGRRQ